MADDALAAIIEPMRRPDDVYSWEDCNVIGTAFGDCLHVHPEVAEALDDGTPDHDADPFMFEGYIAHVSRAWEIEVIVAGKSWDDDSAKTRIRRVTTH